MKLISIVESVIDSFRTIRMSFEGSRRYYTMKLIDQYLKDNNLNYNLNPIELSEIPDFENIRDKIRDYCEQNLSQNQFLGIQERKEDLVEIAGRFTIKNGKSQSVYRSKPNLTEVKLYKGGGCSSSLFVPMIPTEHLLADEFVEWHTHPLRDAIYPSDGDLDFFAHSLRLCDGKPYFHIIYVPSGDKFSCWKPTISK